MFIFFLAPVILFLSSPKEKESKRKVRKRPELGGRLSDYRNHSMNSLRSNSISCRFACLAFAIQESKKIPIIVHPLKTSSCGMFSRSLFAVWSSWTSQASKLETALRATCFLEFNSRKHSCVPAVASSKADYRTSYSMFSRI